MKRLLYVSYKEISKRLDGTVVVCGEADRIHHVKIVSLLSDH